MFNQSRVAAMLPAQDLNRAKAFYRDKLGLTPTQEMGDDLVFYMMGGGTGFLVYRSEGKAPGSYTQLFVEVPDVEQAVKDLKGRGVKLEEYDSPGLKTNDGIADIGGSKAAWLKDSEGNLIGLGPPVPVGAAARA
jgi:predicted enzyme related to lactoylglutathione lyase